MGLTFRRPARLQRRADYQRVFREAKPRHHPLVVLRHAPSALGPGAPTRFGFTVSKRISKRAVVRNRIRRVWKEAARLERPHIVAGRDIVLNAKQVPLEAFGLAEAREALRDLARAEGLLIREP